MVQPDDAPAGERALMNEWLGELPIWLVAENGLWVRPPPRSSDGLPAEANWEMTKDEVRNNHCTQMKKEQKKENRGNRTEEIEQRKSSRGNVTEEIVHFDEL